MEPDSGMPPAPSLPLRWRVGIALPVLKLVGMAGLLLLGTLFGGGDPVRLGVAVLAAAGLLIWAVRDLVAPVRLTADLAGVTVPSGYLGRRHIPWSQVERIVVDTRSRRGLRTEILEIDTGASLHLFSRYDLDASPTDVAAALRQVHASAASASDGRPG